MLCYIHGCVRSIQSTTISSTTANLTTLVAESTSGVVNGTLLLIEVYKAQWATISLKEPSHEIFENYMYLYNSCEVSLGSKVVGNLSGEQIIFESL